MYSIVFFAPFVATLVALIAWYVTRTKDFTDVSLRLAAEEIQAEEENEAWSRALRAQQIARDAMLAATAHAPKFDGNRTIFGW